MCDNLKGQSLNVKFCKEHVEWGEALVIAAALELVYSENYSNNNYVAKVEI